MKRYVVVRAEPYVDHENDTYEGCHLCGRRTESGYGFAGGGCGTYQSCPRHGIISKWQDLSESEMEQPVQKVTTGRMPRVLDHWEGKLVPRPGTSRSRRAVKRAAIQKVRRTAKHFIKRMQSGRIQTQHPNESRPPGVG